MKPLKDLNKMPNGNDHPEKTEKQINEQTNKKRSPFDSHVGRNYHYSYGKEKR